MTPRPIAPMSTHARPLALLSALILGACSDSAVTPETIGFEEVDLVAPWRTATVAQVGGSPDAVDRGVKNARANHRLLSLLAVKNGRLVLEEYFAGNRSDSLNDVRSITKSVVSALAGIAVEEGHLESLDDPISAYLAPVVGELDPGKGAITVRHLLTMTGGFAWDEDGPREYNDWILSGEHLAHLLDRPLADEPGSSFEYNSAAVHLLGVVLEEAVGRPLPAYADEVLFGPIGVAAARWEPLPGGRVNGGAGLDLRPRDLARFGQLFLQEGRSGGRQILPPGWAELSTVERFGWRFGDGSLQGVTYGMLWWVVPSAPEPFFFAWGYGGQYVVVVPELELVVVATSNWRGVRSDGGADRYERATMTVILEDIIAAFR